MSSVTLTDIAKAKAFALWAKSAIGYEPTITNYDNEYLEIDFSKTEIKAWTKYFDGLILKGLKPSPPGTVPPAVQIRFGKVLIPWASRYIIALLVGGFIIGRISKR